MPNNEWRIKSKSDTEIVYEIKDGSLSSDYIQDCTPDENRRINDWSQVMRFNPKAGFYQIKGIHQQKKYKSEEEEFAARYAFKENIEKKFVDVGTSIRLQPFFNEASEGTNRVKERFLNNLVGLVDKVIHVQSWGLVESSYQGKPTKVNKVKWLILNDDLISGNESPTGMIDEGDLEFKDIRDSFDPQEEDIRDSFDDPQDEEIYDVEAFE